MPKICTKIATKIAAENAKKMQKGQRNGSTPLGEALGDACRLSDAAGGAVESVHIPSPQKKKCKQAFAKVMPKYAKIQNLANQAKLVKILI